MALVGGSSCEGEFLEELRLRVYHEIRVQGFTSFVFERFTLSCEVCVMDVRFVCYAVTRESCVLGLESLCSS